MYISGAADRRAPVRLRRRGRRGEAVGQPRLGMGGRRSHGVQAVRGVRQRHLRRRSQKDHGRLIRRRLELLDLLVKL